MTDGPPARTVPQASDESGWTVAEIADQTGRTALVTGATGGLGRHVAVELARVGARVLITGRDAARNDEVVAAIAAQVPGSEVQAYALDLADLASVRDTARAVAAAHPRLDLLVANAGVMATPRRSTVDGFELQMGTNHLGHFALAGQLLSTLVRASGRVVWVSSLGHRLVRTVRPGSLTAGGAPGRYSRWRSYAESKLAMLLCAQEMERRMRAEGLDVTSVAAHPGYSATGLQEAGLAMGSTIAHRALLKVATMAVGQSAQAGALPLLYAATEPDLPAGAYAGPSSPGEMRGLPRLVGMSRQAADPRLAARVWASSQDAVGVRWP